MTTITRRRRLAMAIAGVATATATTISPAPAAHGAELWGAIAYAFSGAWGRAQDYATKPAAEGAALRACGYSDCKVLTSFTGCGAVAANGFVRQGGFGPTLAAATNDALVKIGGGWIDSWACN
jgi:Domain of unknown function (DUF4189)